MESDKSPSLPPPTPVPGFQYIKYLGKGGQAAVSLEKHIKTDKKRAVKRFSFRKGDVKKYLKSEIQIMKQLKLERHPHLVRLHEVVPLGERELALVLEYCDGGTLRDFMKQKKSSRYIGEGKAKKLFQDLALGLSHLYEIGIVHRDLKPENLLLKKKGTETMLKVADFGLSKQLDEGQKVMTTQLGTRHYAAPEIGTQGFQYSSLSDLWSAGAILYEMLSGYMARTKIEEKQFPTIKEGDTKFPPDRRLLMENLYEGAPDFIEGLLKADPKERMTWEEFFSHSWLDLGSRKHFNFDEENLYDEKHSYRINEMLTKGVYEATEKATERTVVLKKVTESEEAMMGLLNQKHSNIVKVYRHHKRRDGVYFVMEYCEGGDLLNYIDENGPLGEELTKSLMQDLAKALQFLKSLHIVHCDIKPANFLLKQKKNGRLRLRLADFGNAVQVQDYSQTLQKHGGTTPYLSPESLPSSTEEKNSLADLWSAGVSMYQMLFERFPFSFPEPSENQRLEIMRNIQDEPIDFSGRGGKEGEELSAECMDLLERLLQKDPQKRITWAQFFAHPWLELPGITDPITESLQTVAHLIKLTKRCPNYAASFSLHMEALSILEEFLPKEGGESPDIAMSGDFSSISSSSSSSIFPSPGVEAEFFSTYREICEESSWLRHGINTPIPSPLDVIYQQILVIGKRAAQDEFFGENVLEEYEFCLSLLGILSERVGKEDWELVRGLRERFEQMYEEAMKGRY